MKNGTVFLAAIVLLGLISLGPVSAAWTVTSLHPSGAAGSWSNGLTGGSNQVGCARGTDNNPHAGYWSGTSGSWVDLHPVGTTQSYANESNGSQMVGQTWTSSEGYYRAALWSLIPGTARINLHPAGASESLCYGIYGDTQVGWATFGGYNRAGYWRGSAASWTSIHPAGYQSSQAWDIYGNRIAGNAVASGGVAHAALWNQGTFTDLNPTGVTASYASGVSADQVVGYATYGTQERAALWNASGSYTDLHPYGGYNSRVESVSNGWQAGYVFTSSTVVHAGIWHGSKGTWIDLHNLMPAGPRVWTKAMDIQVNGADVWVSGIAYNSAMSNYEAVLWHGTVPEPSSLVVLGAGLPGLLLCLRRRRG